MTRRALQRADEAHGDELRYRAYPSFGLLLPILSVLAFLLAWPLVWLNRAGVPLALTGGIGGAVMGVVIGIPTQRIALSADGRLIITRLGRRIDVEVNRLTAIRVTGRARKGFGGALFCWDGGRFHLWPSMRRHPDPSPWYLKGRRPPHVGEDFRDLVHRLYVTNPAMTIEGVEPPAYALPPSPTVGHW